MNNLPFPYYFYGSSDSLDTDVIIEIPKDIMPFSQEERKIYVKNLEKQYGLSDWNINLIVVENGYVIDTIYPKTWIDSTNNSLYTTYNNHLYKQKYDLCIKGLMKRNLLLAIYKTVRTVLTMLTRTEYRTEIKPYIKGIHPFELKLKALSIIDFTKIEQFNQDNTKDIDVWKIIAFYIGQNISLIRDNIEIYTKKDLINNHPLLFNFIQRQELNNTDKYVLNVYIKEYLDIINKFGKYSNVDNILYCNDEIIDMKDEKY